MQAAYQLYGERSNPVVTFTENKCKKINGGVSEDRGNWYLRLEMMEQSNGSQASKTKKKTSRSWPMLYRSSRQTTILKPALKKIRH